ncbi:MAG: hypothetical protein ABSH08_20770 [Tepidisphaeraceae bacterium]|jgi:hypothetical protein
MKHGWKIACGLILTILIATSWAQEQQSDAIDVAPGFKLGVDGVIEIGDISAEVGHFDANWTVSEQHDVFKAQEPNPPATQPSSHVVTGVFVSESGPFNLTERMDAAGGGVHFSASMASDKPVETNELYMSFSMPVSSVGGKQALIDGQPTLLPSEPAKPGEAHLIDKDGVHKIEIPMPTGTLIITGNLNMLLQDDREWNDDRFSLRLNFLPASGQLKESKIEFQMKWKPAENK